MSDKCKHEWQPVKVYGFPCEDCGQPIMTDTTCAKCGEKWCIDHLHPEHGCHWVVDDEN